MASADAFLEALDREPLTQIRSLLGTPGGEAFRHLVATVYLPRPAIVSGLLDSEEAAESVVVTEDRMSAAAFTWSRLTDSERRCVKEIADALCGFSAGKEMAFDLDIRLP